MGVGGTIIIVGLVLLVVGLIQKNKGLAITGSVVGGSGVVLTALMAWNDVVQAHTAVEETKKLRAKMDVKILTNAAIQYQMNRGEWPVTLADLAKPREDGMPPFVAESQLTDPWGRPYHCDPNQLDPQTQLSVIWSEGPEPGEPGSKITNR